MRYASLHRAVERGMASDEVWNELARVCLELQFPDEAVRAFRNMADGALKNSLESLLNRRGLLNPSAPTRRAVPQVAPEVVKPRRTALKDHVTDGFHYLFREHMPLTVIVATVTFPLVVGLGGILTKGSSMLLLPAIALLPGLSVLGIVGAMGRRILIESSRGLEDPPGLPDLTQLFREAGRFLLDMIILIGVLVGPGLGMAYLGVPLTSTLPALALGALCLPMALAIRQLTDDWRALSPPVLVRAVGRGGVAYCGLAAIITGLFLPATAATALTLGAAPHLQIALIGPLAVLPLFVASRMMGTFVDAHRSQLWQLIALPGVDTVAPTTAPKSSPLRQPPAPKARAKRSTAARQAARRRPARQPLGAPSHPEANQSGTRPALPPKPRKKRAAAPQKKPVVATTAARPRSAAPVHDKLFHDHSPIAQGIDDESVELPDLANMPGVHIVKGEERERSGAAAKRKP